MDIYQNIKDGKYDNKMTYPTRPKESNFRFKQDGNSIFREADYEQALKDYRTMTEAYRLEGDRLIDLFKSDTLEELGLTDHPKADRFFDLCWQQGHAHGSGFNDVWLTMEDWSDLLT